MYDYGSGNEENELFTLISCLLDFAKAAYEKGVVFLQEDIAGYPPDILLFYTMQKVTAAILADVSFEEIRAMVADGYRQEKETERDFILMCTKSIYFNISWKRLERCILQKLTANEKHDYLRYWKRCVSEQRLGYLVARRRRGV